MTVITQDVPQGNSQEAKSDLAEVTVAEWPINNRGETARISLELYKGAWRIGCRKWCLDDDGKLCPTRQGISLRVEHLPRLAGAVAKALTAAHERGLIQADREGGQ
jgi:transcriptional coactivator p15 (PC4)